MKKGLIFAVILAACTFMPAFAQESTEKTTSYVWDHGNNVSDISYRNAAVFRVLDGKDAYVVLYEKGGTKVGTAIIPKSWTKNEPRTLEFRNKPAGLGSYMTVMYQNGEFYKVWLTVSPNRTDSVWGVLPHGTELPGLDKTSLDIEF